MKTLFFTLLTFVSLISCNRDDDNNSEEETTTEAGTANITLTAGGEQYKITGSCGGASVMGQNYIGAKDEANNLKTFSTYFNITALPAATTTYTLVADQNDTAANHIWMNITEIRGGGLFEYTSSDTSGTLTLKVEGKKVSVDLGGIVLKPSTNSGAYTNLNVGAFSNPGTLSGTLVFYKD